MGGKRLEDFKAVGGWGDRDRCVGAGDGLGLGRYDRFPDVNPAEGSSSPRGASNLKGLPLASVKLSISGLKPKSPAKAIAVTISGEARKFMVFELAIVASLEIAIKRRQNGVLFPPFLFSIPLADARAACVG